MSSPASCAAEPSGRFRRLYVERELEDSPYLAPALARLPGLAPRWVAGKEDIPPDHLEAGTLLLARPRGRVVKRCPGSPGHLCCNYRTVDLYLGCTLGCAYCILRGYLNFAPVTVYLDPEPAIAGLRRLAGRGRAVRVGTGELGDSLELDTVFRLSERLILAAASYPNLALELKTKTAQVDHLLEVEPKGRAVIGFSLNAESASRAYEPGAALLAERLSAARRAAAAGYRVAFHFDPLVLLASSVEQTLAEYRQVVARLGGFAPGQVAWISLGCFRYPPGLERHIASPELLAAELVPCRDGKHRYLQPVRSRLYRGLVEELARHVESPVYLCMESPAVWRNVFGRHPRETPSLRDIFEPVHGGPR